MEKIGVIARYTGLAPHTIKYYENMGLISSVRDDQSNYRYYELNQRTIIHECVHYRKLDFALKDIEYLIMEADSEGVDDCYTRHLQDLEAKISELQIIKQRVEKNKRELDEWDEKENLWFVEAVDPALIFWQTKGTEWIPGRELDKAGLDFENYDTRTYACIQRDSIYTGELTYSWGRGIDECDYEGEPYQEDLVERFTSSRAYVTYVKVDEAVASGKLIQALDEIFVEPGVFKEYPGNIYLRRIKMVFEKDRPVSYYKVMIPIPQSL